MYIGPVAISLYNLYGPIKSYRHSMIDYNEAWRFSSKIISEPVFGSTKYLASNSDFCAFISNDSNIWTNFLIENMMFSLGFELGKKSCPIYFGPTVFYWSFNFKIYLSSLIFSFFTRSDFVGFLSLLADYSLFTVSLGRSTFFGFSTTCSLIYMCLEACSKLFYSVLILFYIAFWC